LDPIFELKVQGYFLVAVSVSQNGDRLARVMITVMKEKNDFSADLLLKTPDRRNLSEQKSLWKKSARLLAETNNRVIHRPESVSYSGRSVRAAKDGLLQDWRQDQDSCASDKIIPEVSDIRRSE
jgi:pyrimidine operon attenuation protein/uracil phosphoribosyltransferase